MRVRPGDWRRFHCTQFLMHIEATHVNMFTRSAKYTAAPALYSPSFCTHCLTHLLCLVPRPACSLPMAFWSSSCLSGRSLAWEKSYLSRQPSTQTQAVSVADRLTLRLSHRTARELSTQVPKSHPVMPLFCLADNAPTSCCPGRLSLH